MIDKKYQMFTKWPQILHIHENRILKKISSEKDRPTISTL